MSIDVLMVSESFTGEASRHGQQDAIELLSYSFSADRAAGGIARTTQAAAYSSVNVMATLDQGIAELFAMFAGNRQMDEVVIMQFRAGGDDDVLIWSLTMTDVLVESFSFAGSEGLPVANLTLKYRKGQVLYMPQAAAGLAVDPVIFEFDMTATL